MLPRSRFALNRIACPRLPLPELFSLAGGLGLGGVELRNDLPGGRVLDDLSPAALQELSERYALRVLSINALQHFNVAARLDELERELAGLVELAGGIGCPAVVLCPHNDPGDGRSAAERYAESLAALKRFGPLLSGVGMLGYIEPLGFSVSSLDSLIDAGHLIEESGQKVYRTVFDTFHHFLGPDDRERLRRGYDPRHTGLMHISGVFEDVPGGAYLDEHRGLPGEGDRLGSRGQLQFLLGEGYAGPVSLEPFAPAVQRLDAPALRAAIRAALEYLGADDA
jgi:2-keto-myo-inositol isomerase